MTKPKRGDTYSEGGVAGVVLFVNDIPGGYRVKVRTGQSRQAVVDVVDASAPKPKAAKPSKDDELPPSMNAPEQPD
jgi:hypothetical protein